MQCVSPIFIRTKGERHFVPCGRCNACLSTRRNEWSFRLKQELKVAKSAAFLTMTYDDDKLPRTEHDRPTLCKSDFQRFMKRLRKAQSKLTDTKIRYYAVGEYGSKTHRPHYHAILFNVHNNLDYQNIWKDGHIHIGTVTPSSIHYTTKYVVNRYDYNDDEERPFSLMSRKPGLGANYLQTHSSWHKEGKRTYAQDSGHKTKLPRFYKEKLFPDGQKSYYTPNTLKITDEEYKRTIEELSKTHDNPEAYYIQCLRHQHDTMMSKSNQKSDKL